MAVNSTAVCLSGVLSNNRANRLTQQFKAAAVPLLILTRDTHTLTYTLLKSVANFLLFEKASSDPVLLTPDPSTIIYYRWL